MKKKIKDDGSKVGTLAQPAQAKSRKNPAAAKAAADKTALKGFDFIGKVESISVKAGPDGEVFEFGIRGRHGLRQRLQLQLSTHPARTIMASVVTAAHAAETKIGVRVASTEGGIPGIVEVVSRPKLGRGT